MSPTISKTVAVVNDGDIISLEENNIKKNKNLTFSGNIETLGSITFTHGEGSSGAYLIIDSTNIKIYNHNITTNVYDLSKTLAHGLTISGQTNMSFTTNDYNKLSIVIESNGNIYTQDNLNWVGSKGEISMKSTNSILSDVTLTYECKDYDADVWFFGDSYTSITSKRWPYYLIEENIDFLLSGYPGAKSNGMYPDFLTAITHGKPKYAVWCLGMNDVDTSSGINTDWKRYVELFIGKCNELGITPILTTIPNVPDRIHTFKNEYVRNSGYRYIDFATAVGANEVGSTWTEGMLNTNNDNVHPDVLGAQALANQILIDLPEIK